MKPPTTLTPITAADAGISGNEQIQIALRAIEASGGVSPIAPIKEALRREVERQKPGCTLSEQGKQSLAAYVNRQAKAAGLVRLDKIKRLWHITEEGRDLLTGTPETPERVVNVETQEVETKLPTPADDIAFEKYVLGVLKRLYPHYAWYHQGRHKAHERGLDMIGERIGDIGGEPQRIGVQVKNHGAMRSPAPDEWLKFMAGCFARRVDSALFVTTGRLRGELRREASEAKVIVIEGLEELERQALRMGGATYEQFLSADSVET